MIQGKIIDFVPLSANHNEFMVSLLNNQEIAFLEGRTEPMVSIEKQDNWYRNNLNSPHQYLIIQPKNDTKPVGYMSMKITDKVSGSALLGIKLPPESQRKGYGLDAVKTLMNHCFFTFNLHRLYSYILEYNEGSQHLFINKCGWRIEGTEKKSIFARGEYHDRLMLAILREEFIKNETDPFYNPFASGNH